LTEFTNNHKKEEIKLKKLAIQRKPVLYYSNLCFLLIYLDAFKYVDEMKILKKSKWVISMLERCEEESGGDKERLLQRLTELESELGEKKINAVVAVAKALGHPQRLKLLAAIGAEEVCVCKLAGVSDLSQPAISHHLNILARSRLLQRRRKGRFNHYKANPELIQKLVDQVQELLT
jgi:ArsR family transcriptional regulator